MAILQSKNLSIGDIHRLFNYQRQYNDSFTSLLSLESLTEFEQQELLQIRTDFDNYIIESKVLEGLVKALTVFPLMRLAGFYRSPIKIALEENIADIVIEDEDTKVTGRLDILAVNKAKLNAAKVSFWVLVIESKNSEIAVSAGLPQLLSYAYQCLEHQKSVWGLTTNGREYQFVYIQQGNPPIYQLMPLLNLMESERSVELLQVLKAICELG
ncbi:restriction endonuclease subunit R [Rivularia sp. UHCC 0363]|uniref:restriction endonuclease subunit R n=1 Tax=Rivularia sp. UHCC 0363 TaxID=3110244 RepID=UPI002B1F6448|nr:restriction endonuclease subunit R [Rivularia sp. UHCC 0363]MEA5597621.1 restriction endonuclease subunit R [Rivularia sp. UHCC 0363]